MITAVILTKNASKTLLPLLEALESINVVLIDTGSIDNTLDLASKFSNVQTFSFDFLGFGTLKNQGAKLAKDDWILSLDADELPSNDLIQYLMNTQLDPNTIYSFPFHNYYKEKRIYGCGWNPESHVRLYNKTTTSFCESLVHERIVEDGLNKKMLPFPIKHFSYLCIDDFLRKLSHYTTLFAEQNHKLLLVLQTLYL